MTLEELFERSLRWIGVTMRSKRKQRYRWTVLEASERGEWVLTAHAKYANIPDAVVQVLASRASDE